MLISRLSRVGFQMMKELSRGKSLLLTRTGCLQRPYGRLSQPLLELCSETRTSQLAKLELHPHFCTTAADSTCDEGNEEDDEETISVTFVGKDGEEKHVKVPIGMSMLEAAHENDIDLAGLCEGSLSCSTCHVIVMDMEYYNKLEDPADAESDMLDLALGLTETSRLGCQLIAKPELDGIRIALPATSSLF